MTVQIISIEFNENGNFAVVVVALVHSPILCFRQWWFFVVSYFKPFMTKTRVFSVCVCVCVQQNEFRVQLRVQIQFLPKNFPSSIRNWRYDSWNLSRWNTRRHTFHKLSKIRLDLMIQYKPVANENVRALFIDRFYWKQSI